MDKMLEARELFPVDAQTMPPSGMMDDIGGIGPKEIQFGNASTMDFSVALEKIKSGNARTEEIYALYNTPGVKLGSEVKSAVEDFIRQDQPELMKTRENVMGSGQGKILGDVVPIESLRGEKFRTPEEGIGTLSESFNIPATYQSTARSTLGGIGEFAREGLEGASDFFLGKRAGDVFRAEQYGGDRDFFLRSGGRTPSEVNRMVMSMNDPEQSVSPIGFIGDSISDALDRFGIDTDFFSKDPSEMILETDTVERKKFEEAQIQEQINNVSDAAEDGGQPDVDTPDVSVIEVEEGGGEDDDESGDQDNTLETEEQITSEEAPKRNFAEFIQSPDFIRFARNIGKGLATTGQIGQGIALGAAGAAEEKEAERQAEREAEIAMATKEGGFNRFLAEQRVKNTAPDKIAEQTTKLSEAINDIEQGEISMQMFNSVKEIMSESEITGLGAITSSLFAQARGFLPGGSQEPTTPRERAIVILEQIANGNIKTITGESGRTISNVDRQIAEKLVGSLKNPLTRETEVLERIEAQINSVTQRTNTARNKYDAISLYFTTNGLPIPLRPRSYGVPTTEVSAANPYPNTTFIDATKK
jgi:hypothetical protein